MKGRSVLASPGLVTLGTLLVGGGAIMADTGPIVILDTILGSSYLAIRAAMTNVQRHQLDVAKYNFELVRDRISETVVLLEKDQADGAPPILGVRLGSGAELSKDELRSLLNVGGSQVLDVVQGSSFLAIQAAMAV